ncbi:AraC-type DNA-binding domain-containing protein [Marinobacter santoriniensis NKSG1]|uniref:AraC-type DNA-binding domain-containing protein n=1 Tax=Marinobacter santoriniensis NKSG1 TaxID=1288826 RepID=M7D4U8_9GAMM|nr:AraC family transcriptional regulator [Marinobacter santoriniensis]EMP55763.1 AraC-type DNA-binding domain-containing protein [Marinobacter santoriniensis NKSG1]
MLDARLQKLPIASHQHRHEHHQIVVGVQGEAELSVDGNGSHLDTWKACLVPTEAPHDYCGDNQNHVMVINLDPYIPALNSPAHADYDRLAPLFEKTRTLDMDSRLQGLVQFAAGEFGRSPENDAMRRHLAASILHCMADRMADRRARLPARYSVNPDLVRRYILRNLHRKITVEDMAREACLSVSRFHEVFREGTGITPHQFLLKTRLDKATQLLTSTALSIAEISYRTGFSSQSALTNALRKHNGTTPSRLQSGACVD